MKYMIRRKFFAPKSEVERYYGRQDALKPSDMICAWEWDDEGDTVIADEKSVEGQRLDD